MAEFQHVLASVSLTNGRLGIKFELTIFSSLSSQMTFSRSDLLFYETRFSVLFLDIGKPTNDLGLIRFRRYKKFGPMSPRNGASGPNCLISVATDFESNSPSTHQRNSEIDVERLASRRFLELRPLCGAILSKISLAKCTSDAVLRDNDVIAGIFTLAPFKKLHLRS